jgi:apolipoprotein D and lipocalin family protein
MNFPRLLLALGALLGMSGCSTTATPPLTGLQRPVDLQRFMGDWYVIAFKPIDLPFISEAGAHNAVESYRLAADGTIETTYTFRDGGFAGPAKRMTPRGRVANPPLNSEWKMKFFWFLPAGDYLVTWLDENYQRTIIAVPDRRWVWLMARTPQLSDSDYSELVAAAREAGFDPAQLRRVPQRW